MDGVKVIVYVRADDARFLRGISHDPAEWVRGLVRWGIDRERTREKEAHERLRPSG
jgi:hypothetical protein